MNRLLAWWRRSRPNAMGELMEGLVKPASAPRHPILIDDTNDDGLLLLRLDRGDMARPIHFVVEYPHMWNPDDDTWPYYVNEGTCPTNIIRVSTIIEGTDIDPHGILAYVQWVPRPPDWDMRPRTGDYAFFRRIFSALPEIPELDSNFYEVENKRLKILLAQLLDYLNNSMGPDNPHAYARDYMAEKIKSALNADGCA